MVLFSVLVMPIAIMDDGREKLSVTVVFSHIVFTTVLSSAFYVGRSLVTTTDMDKMIETYKADIIRHVVKISDLKTGMNVLITEMKDINKNINNRVMEISDLINMFQSKLCMPPNKELSQLAKMLNQATDKD